MKLDQSMADEKTLLLSHFDRLFMQMVTLLQFIVCSPFHDFFLASS